MSRVYQALNRAEVEGKNRSTDFPPSASFAPTEFAVPEADFAPTGVPTMISDPEPLEDVQVVTFVPQSDSHVVVGDTRYRAAAEAFRLLRYRLEKLRERQSIGSVLITSAVPKEGKTLVAINLASALALTSNRVLLVDADLRGPTAHTALGLSALPGLAEVLESSDDIPPTYRRVNPLGFYLLQAGTAVTNPVELLQSAKMRALMNNLTSSFDWVILDSPPLLPFADGHCLASLCNGVLMVAREGTTPKEDLERALASLKLAHVLGTVLNETHTPKQGDYYSSYTKTKNTNGAAAGNSADPQ